MPPCIDLLSGGLLFLYSLTLLWLTVSLFNE